MPAAACSTRVARPDQSYATIGWCYAYRSYDHCQRRYGNVRTPWVDPPFEGGDSDVSCSCDIIEDHGYASPSNVLWLLGLLVGTRRLRTRFRKEPSGARQRDRIGEPDAWRGP
jgi:hypothetical protein